MTRTAWWLFLSLSLIWGVPYFFIKVALHDLTPAWIAFGRVALGALLLAPFVPRRDWPALKPRLVAIAIVAATDIAIPFLLIANGERYVSSALTGLLLAAIPLTVALLGLAFASGERLSRVQSGGLCIGFAGVSVLLGFNVGHDRAALSGAALIAGATLSYSIGILLIKRCFHDVPTLATTAALLAFAACLLAPLTVFSRPAHLPGPAAIGAVVTLAAVCTAAAYVLDFALIARAGALRASVVAYLNPVVAALLGIAALHESISPTAVLGIALVIAGSWFSTRAEPAALEPLQHAT